LTGVSACAGLQSVNAPNATVADNNNQTIECLIRKALCVMC
jgi:hypothetical protein